MTRQMKVTVGGVPALELEETPCLRFHGNECHPPGGYLGEFDPSKADTPGMQKCRTDVAA